MGPMARPRGCPTCGVELETIALAHGSPALYCAACDTLADAAHCAAGRPGWPAGMARKPLKLVVNRPKSYLTKKIIYSGKKSLTA